MDNKQETSSKRISQFNSGNTDFSGQLPPPQNQTAAPSKQQISPTTRTQLNPTATPFVSIFQKNNLNYAPMPNGQNVYGQNPVYTGPSGLEPNGQNVYGKNPVYTGPSGFKPNGQNVYRQNPVYNGPFNFLPRQQRMYPGNFPEYGQHQIGQGNSIGNFSRPQNGPALRMVPPGGDFLRQPAPLSGYHQHRGGLQVEGDEIEREQRLRVQHRDETVENIKIMLGQMSGANA